MPYARVFYAALVLCASCAACRADARQMKTSWYGSGELTACGEPFDRNDPTIAAHRSLPCGTVLRITNPENGKRIWVTVVDRGPYIKGRSLDLSWAAAKKLDFLEEGIAMLDVVIVSIPDSRD